MRAGRPLPAPPAPATLPGMPGHQPSPPRRYSVGLRFRWYRTVDVPGRSPDPAGGHATVAGALRSAEDSVGRLLLGLLRLRLRVWAPARGPGRAPREVRARAGELREFARLAAELLAGGSAARGV